MTAQSSLMVAAPIHRDAVDPLKTLLSSMCAAPGQADPLNPMVPFARFENLHFSRLVVLDDQTLHDITLYGLPVVDYPIYLAFLADFDGDKQQFLSDLVRIAGDGLRRIFAFCEGFRDGSDLVQWMRDHDLPIATSYINWPGRTVRQIREEADLRHAVARHLRQLPGSSEATSPVAVWNQARVFLKAENAAGRLALTPLTPPSFGQRVSNAIHFFGAGLGIVLTGLAIAPIVVFAIRPAEKNAPVYAPVPQPAYAGELAKIEDYEFTNQFSAMGSVKPGWAHVLVLRYVLWLIEWTARHIYTKGRLARVRSIHFARWVFLDNHKRILFASNYDGSLESYMDDFINKVFFGLNVVFSAGIGYPSTRWLLEDGAWDEQKFEYFLRRHQLPTQVWYNAYPSMTAVEQERNSRVRQGLESASISEEAARQWLQLL
jgi:hypothetical protein